MTQFASISASSAASSAEAGAAGAPPGTGEPGRLGARRGRGEHQEECGDPAAESTKNEHWLVIAPPGPPGKPIARESRAVESGKVPEGCLPSSGAARHSHSMVAGGFDEMS